MPCTDGGPSLEQIKAQENAAREEFYRIRNIEATLCGLLTYLENCKLAEQTLDQLNYKEMGVSKEWVRDWWEDHQEKDRLRIAQEKAKQKYKDEKARRKAEAEKLKKSLTPEQKKLLKEFGV